MGLASTFCSFHIFLAIFEFCAIFRNFPSICWFFKKRNFQFFPSVQSLAYSFLQQLCWTPKFRNFGHFLWILESLFLRNFTIIFCNFLAILCIFLFLPFQFLPSWVKMFFKTIKKRRKIVLGFLKITQKTWCSKLWFHMKIWSAFQKKTFI